MMGEIRRKEIVNRLSAANAPLSATALAGELGVSRQIIVQDIALLRAAGYEIVSLARGYRLSQNSGCKRVFKVFHTDEDVEKELNLIVDMGGTVVDIFVYHRAYGTVKAKMGIKSRIGVKKFLEELSSGKSSLLKNVTDGYHYHTVETESKEIMDMIEKTLKENGFLAPLKEFEPEEISNN